MPGRRRCCCSAPVATPHTWRGCNGLVLPNYTIDIYSTNPATGGVLLETVTTNSSGVGNAVSTGTVWAQSPDGRFSGQLVNLSFSGVGLTALGAAYRCHPFCAVPLKKVLTYTSTTFGTWTGDSFSMACPATAWPASGYSIIPSPAAGFTLSTPSPGFLPQDLACSCSGANMIYGTSMTWSCPPALSIVGTYVYPLGTPDPCVSFLVPGFTDTLTITE